MFQEKHLLNLCNTYNRELNQVNPLDYMIIFKYTCIGSSIKTTAQKRGCNFAYHGRRTNDSFEN